MIDYEYTKVNRLEIPHNYMYSLYQGSEFLDAYFQDRLKCVESFQEIKEWEYKYKVGYYLHSKAVIVLKTFFDKELFNELDKSFRELIDLEDILKVDDSFIDNIDINIEVLSSYSISDKVVTKNLLISLLNSQLNNGDKSLIKYWLDLLVQRFEVTKKLYESYPINFRKGEGGSNDIQLYWMFALSLTLFYYDLKSTKYLSTLLKTTDLLCSLDEIAISQKIPPQGISLILYAELLSIKMLTNLLHK
jgi:hypothetical protein